MGNNSASGKTETLFELLDPLISEGQKVLVFSQFTSLLSIVRAQMDAAGTRYAYLDGDTKDRNRVRTGPADGLAEQPGKNCTAKRSQRNQQIQ